MRIDCGHWAAAASLALVACGVGPPQYSGVSRPQAATPEAISVVPETAFGYTALGSVRAGCSWPDFPADRTAVRASLADFLCSRSLLVDALSEQAALVGGSALTRLECSDSGASLRCRARVVAARSGTTDWAGVVDSKRARAWDIQMVFEPTRVAAVRWNAPLPARVQAPVESLHYVRANELVLGQLEASCGACRPDEVSSAMLQAAGRLGGHSLVGLSCHHVPGVGHRCRGELAALEVRAEAL